MTDFQKKIEKGIYWLGKFKVFDTFFIWLAKTEQNRIRFLLCFNIFNAGLIITALASPWIFVIWGLVIPILVFRSSPLASLANLLSMVRKRSIGFGAFMVTVFFMMLHYIFLFACFYMLFGSVVDSTNRQPITSLWDHIYFSTVTFTTLGYGNLVPADTAAEILSSIESIIGFAGFAFLIGVASAIAVQPKTENEE